MNWPAWLPRLRTPRPPPVAAPAKLRKPRIYWGPFGSWTLQRDEDDQFPPQLTAEEFRLRTLAFEWLTEQQLRRWKPRIRWSRENHCWTLAYPTDTKALMRRAGEDRWRWALQWVRNANKALPRP